MPYTLKTLLQVPYGATAAAAVAAAIKTAFTTGGWTQTSDTGQVDPASWPTSVAAYGAYMIFHLGDSLQSTAPFFVKVNCWLGGDADGVAGMPLFSVGTSTDGAGNLTGNVTYILSNSNVASSEISVPQTCYFVCDTDRFAMVLYTGPTYYAEYAIGIERTKNASTGADTADGLLLLGNSNTAVAPGGGAFATSQMLGASSLPSDQGPLPYWPAAVNLAAPTMATSSSLGVALPVCFNVRPYPTGYNFLLYQGSDFAAYTAYALTVYGSSHNYIALSGNAHDPTLALYGWAATQSHLLLRFE
jgi:hypothetical protein